MPKKKQSPYEADLFADPPSYPTNLSPKYTFENFIVGNSNRFAKAAAMAVANTPATAYNPFFLFSDSGLGKTHIMNAIGNQIQKKHPKMTVLYISSETFTNELIEAVEHNRLEQFRGKYRSIDVLLIDDIQFLRHKESTQEEFLFTFNALKNANKQIVISSDRPPAELDALEERMISRFRSGLTADIQHPDLETRMAILQSFAQKDHLVLPQAGVVMLASSITQNVRELEGAYHRVTAFAKLTQKPITLELIRSALLKLNIPEQPAFLSVEKIQEAVCQYYQLSPMELTSKLRTKKVVLPRQVAFYLTKQLSGLSLAKIGEAYGGRDHSTVIHACEKIDKAKGNNPQLAKDLTELQRRLEE